MTYLTVPIAAENLDKAAEQIKAAKTAGAEALELRTDYLQNLSTNLVKSLVAQARDIAGRQTRIIATCRDKKQGGAKDYPLQLRIEILADALNAGAEFIDFEYENFIAAQDRARIQVALSHSLKGRLILSAHNFETKFDDIGKLHRHIMTVSPAAIPKLVYTANHINDCFEAFDLLHRTAGERIIFCMGEPGLISRIIAKKLNSFITFASIDDKTATAPGQVTIAKIKDLYRYDAINSDTELYGVIGSPLAHSLSPAVHNAGFTNIKADKLYLPLLVEGGKSEFDAFLRNVLARPWLGFRGFSVTIPHKENALDFVKTKQGFVEPLAKRIGAVNTLIIESRATSDERRIRACNTDYAGALDAITSAMKIAKDDLDNMPVAVIGAGGVARAIAAGLRDTGAKVTIYNRTVKRGENLAADFDCDFAPLDHLPGVSAKLLINCTSIGMHPNVNETPIPKEYLKKDMAVFDTIYNPAETLLLKQAKEVGAKTISGLDMFINQALVQFKLFTGTDATPKLVRKTVSNFVFH